MIKTNRPAIKDTSGPEIAGRSGRWNAIAYSFPLN
jgi:hypothetical protein